MGGSSGGGGGTVDQNVSTTVTNTNIPEEFYPYLQKVLQTGDALMQQEYIPYEGQRTAAYTPEQQAAFQGITSLASRSLPGMTGARSYYASQIGTDPVTGLPVGPDYQSASGGYTAPTTGAAGYTAPTTGATGYTAPTTDASGYTAGTIASSYSPTASTFGGGYAPAKSDFGSGYAGSTIASGYNPNAQTFASGYDPASQAFGSGYGGREVTSSYTDPAAITSGFQGANITSSYDPRQFQAQQVMDRIDQYQNPYLEDVLDRSVARAQEQFDTQQAQRDLAGTQAGGAGAFGSRGQLARLTAADQANRAIGDLEAKQRAAAFDKAVGLATADVDRDLRVQQLSDASDLQAARLGLTAQEATARFGQAAGAQDLQAQIASDAARRAAGQQSLSAAQLSDASQRAAGAQTLQAQQLQDAAARAGGAQTLQAQQLADAAARAAGAQGLQAQIASDAAARAGGAQTLQAQQLADAALRAGGAQTLQAQQMGDAALRAAGAQSLQAQIAQDQANRAAGAQGLDAFRLSEAAKQAAGAQGLDAFRLTEAAKQAAGAQGLDAFRLTEQAAQVAGDQSLRASLANQKAYAEALRRQDAAAAAGLGVDKAEQALDLQRIGALNALGAQQRADQQAILDQQYADFAAQRDYPQQQLAFFSNLLRGMNPAAYAGQTQTTSGPAPNQNAQLLNFLMGAANLAA